MTVRPRLDLASGLLVVWSVVMSVGSQTALRYGMSSFSDRTETEIIADVLRNPFVVLGLLAFGLGTIAWLVVLSRLDLTVAYPLGALNYVLITLASAFVLDEVVPPLRWAGTLLILAGILVISLGERRAQEAPACSR